jgi:preprotein translocase subunit SecA
MNGSEPSLDGLDLVVSLVDQLEPRMRRHSDEELRARTGVFRGRVGAGEGLDSLLPEAFALVREAAYRTIGQRHFDVQILAGAALHAGRVAEMKDGEGKTLTATLPAYLNALAGQGVHVVTLSDDLARRDAEWMGDIYRFLGLEVGVILGRTPLADRRAAYAADVTYASYQELGYDYLRSNMALSADEVVQRGHALAIVDEADAILVDQALAEQVISGPGQGEMGDQSRAVYAAISTRGYLRLYDKLAGMSGTVATAAAELHRSYQLDVVQIPTNKPLIRSDHADDLYRTEQAKFDALVSAISERHQTGQPILISVLSAETAARLAGLLDERGISHTVLDPARLDLEEVARGLGQAGRLGAVTMLTGPARGLDLPLGGAVDRPAEGPPNTEREQVIDAGGLLVLGAERHWSRSGDQRLRDWSGRRGEPGESKFVLSEQDRLLQVWSGRFGEALRTVARVAHRRRVPVLSRLAVQLPGRMQRLAEWRRFQQRMPLLEFDEVIDQQRETAYTTRRQILHGGDNHLHERIIGTSTRSSSTRPHSTARRISLPPGGTSMG